MTMIFGDEVWKKVNELGLKARNELFLHMVQELDDEGGLMMKEFCTMLENIWQQDVRVAREIAKVAKEGSQMSSEEVYDKLSQLTDRVRDGGDGRQIRIDDMYADKEKDAYQERALGREFREIREGDLKREEEVLEENRIWAEAQLKKHEQWKRDQETPDSECITLPDGSCKAFHCKLHGFVEEDCKTCKKPQRECDCVYEGEYGWGRGEYEGEGEDF